MIQPPDTPAHLRLPSITRRRMIGLAALAAGATLLPGRPRPPARAQARPATSAVACAETQQLVLDTAATAEALALTFYERAIQGELFGRLNDEYRRYIRAALDQERTHAAILAGLGARPLVDAFFFPARTFGFDDLSAFLVLMERIEDTMSGMYLAAARRLGELGQPALAAAAGQIGAIEAEQRTIAREMAQQSPPPPNDRCFEQAAPACVAWALDQLGPLLAGAPGYEGPFATPDDAAVDAALGGVRCTPVPPVAAAACAETLPDILATAAVAEGLGVTFYYQGIRAGFFPQLAQQRQWYLQAALDEERQHLAVLTASGAPAPPAAFFFPAGAFADLAVFLGVLEQLEDLFIAAYLAAIQRFARLGQPLLAQIAGQILAVETGHRTLGRVIAEQPLPSDLCLARPAGTCLADLAARMAPFLQGGGHTVQTARPDDAQIDAAVERFGCTPVPLATRPQLVYLPATTR